MKNCYKFLMLATVLFFNGSCALESPEYLRASPVAYQDKFNLDDIPISSYRIFKVPSSSQSKAEKILGGVNYRLLTVSDLNNLFPSNTFYVESLLRREVGDAEKYAKEKEEFAAKKSNDKDFSEFAKIYRDYANYTKTLRPPFFPYLVKAKVYVDGTGAYSVSLKKNMLSVHHGSLAHRDVVPSYRYIVVFVERMVDSVEISAGYAE